MRKKKVLSKFMILCWVAFVAILGCVWPVGSRLDTPAKGRSHFLFQLLGGALPSAKPAMAGQVLLSVHYSNTDSSSGSQSRP